MYDTINASDLWNSRENIFFARRDISFLNFVFLFEAGRNGRENQFHKLLISCHQTWIHHSTSIAARATQKWDSVSRGKPSGKIMKRKLNFSSKLSKKASWSNERLKTNGNKFRISHITISFKWVFYCFDFILLEYFIGSTRSSPKQQKKWGGREGATHRFFEDSQSRVNINTEWNLI